MLRRLKTWGKRSQTILLHYAVIGSGIVYQSVYYLGGLVSDANVKAELDKLNFPAWVGLAFAILGFMTIAARLRPGSQDPV